MRRDPPAHQRAADQQRLLSLPIVPAQQRRVVAYVEVPVGSFAYVRGTPGVYRSSSWGQREFCAACGSFLLYRNQEAPTTVSVNTASLDDPSPFPPTHHLFASRRIPWFDTADALPRHTEFAPTAP